ncbi:MAG: hypothetical protein MUE50_21000 [Pirellulaceae bacterium]|nr:hypothetical protein [Pirellulaceae bacterium]
MRAQLVPRAEQWRWGSLAQRLEPPCGEEPPVLAVWPVSRPRNWLAWVHQGQTERELKAVRLSLQRGGPFGDESWQQRTAEQLTLVYAFRPRGRPRKR